MATTEELEKKLEVEKRAREELEEKLSKQMELMATLVSSFKDAASSRQTDGQVSTASKESSIYVSQGRKIPLFKDAPKSSTETSVQDWCMDVERHLKARGMEGVKASSFILEHLGGKARQEIMRRSVLRGQMEEPQRRSSRTLWHQ